MRTWLSLFVALFLSGCGVDSPEDQGIDLNPNVSGPLAGSESEFEPASYIVAFRAAGAKPPVQYRSFQAEYVGNYLALSERYLTNPGVKSIDYLTAIDLDHAVRRPIDEFPNPFKVNPLQLNVMPGREGSQIATIARVDFTNSKEATETLARWQSDGSIWFADANGHSELSQSVTWQDYATAYEAYQESAWHRSVNLNLGLGFLAQSGKAITSNPIIAVMDSGVDFTHSLLSEQKWQNPKAGASGCANDENGCNTTVGERGVLGNGDVGPFRIDSSGSCPRVKQGEGCEKNCCHGTHVAGIAAGFKSAGGGQMAGICPVCQIMAIRVVDKTETKAEGTILDSSIIKGLVYVSRFTNNGALVVRILNASFGKFHRNRVVGLMVRLLAEAPGGGMLLVAAAGNEDTMKIQYPAGFSDAVAVSNITNGGQKNDSSNFGRWVDIAAPGTSISSAVPGDGIEAKNGTSMAAPVVAGIAGLILASEPNISHKDLRRRILRTANPDLYKDSVNAYYFPRISGQTESIPLLGTGMVDTLRALQGDEARDVPLASASVRVTEQCAVISSRSNGKPWIIFVLFLLPVAVASVARATSRKVKG